MQHAPCNLSSVSGNECVLCLHELQIFAAAESFILRKQGHLGQENLVLFEAEIPLDFKYILPDSDRCLFNCSSYRFCSFLTTIIIQCIYSDPAGAVFQTRVALAT